MRSDAEQYVHPRSLRSPSSASDLMSSSGRSFMGGALPPASPNPAYIALGAAEYLTSSELDRAVNVSASALELVNGFLDQVLYNLLSLSKSAHIDVLRQTVPRLLRPRLGQAAISAADEELKDYSMEVDPEEYQQPPRPIKPSDFDIELAWKLARLRCMVYARLGDMEDEDEEEYLESERLEEFSGSPMSVDRDAAIFLTSILEFLGEQALCNAAQHAEKRHNHRVNRKAAHGQDLLSEEEELVIEHADVLQLGREGPLSRLWRSWRRDSRMIDTRPITPGSAKAPSFFEPSHSRKASHASPTNAIPEEDSPKSEPMTPSQIPLPMYENDIDEIEVPGLALAREGNTARTNGFRPGLGAKRPSSLLIIPGDFPASPEPSSPEVPVRSPLRPHYQRHRSRSLPGPWEKAEFVYGDSYKRDTMMSTATWQTEEPGEFSDDYEEVDAGLKELKLEAEESSRPDTRGSSHYGAINGAAVAAIAGALGVEAARSRTDKDPARPQTPQRRTVAEEMMGPSQKVSAPRDADTRASITGPGDFDILNVPREVREDDTSDPEDLALSSGDEASAVRTRDTRDSGFATSDSQTVVPSSPASPRRNREAAVYENSIVSSPREQPADFGEGKRPSTQESVTFEPSALADTSDHDESVRNRDSDLPLQRPEEFEDGTPVMSSGAWTTSTIPPRMSSRDNPRSQGHLNTASKSSHYSSHSKHSSASSRLLGFARDSNGQPLKEQRADFPDRSPHSRNTSTNTQKVIPGPPVGASPKQNIAARREHLRVRADSEEDAARTRNLEILIKSDETLHYTLTPESARAEDFDSSGTKPKTETQDLADFFRNTAPPGEKVPVSGHNRSAKQSLNGLRSNPPEYAPNTTSGTSRADQSQPAELSAMPGSPRRGNQQARDPRPERNTTRDLADYVRSTGPTNDIQLPQALGAQSEDNPREAIATPRAGPVPRVPDNQRLPASRSTNRLKFQARDARPQPGSETNDLIDFIRQGPPRAPGEHRIDRKVAPFRTTMDSDDLQALAPPSELPGRDSVGSNHESSATKSMQESTNSRTALLDSSRQTNGRVTAPPINHDVKRQVIPEQDGMPPRTRRRVKDPYAIDFSDDEEEEEEEIAKPAHRKEEESLIDFLRNTAPPPGRTAQPIVAAGSRAQQAADLRRTASNSKLRDVLKRTGSTKNTPKSSNIATKDESPQVLRKNTNTLRQEALSGKPRVKYQARDAKTTVPSTSDLADFLMDSGPPPSRGENNQPFRNGGDSRVVRSDVKEQAGFMKFFSRKASVRQ